MSPWVCAKFWKFSAPPLVRKQIMDDRDTIHSITIPTVPEIISYIEAWYLQVSVLSCVFSANDIWWVRFCSTFRWTTSDSKFNIQYLLFNPHLIVHSFARPSLTNGVVNIFLSTNMEFISVQQGRLILRNKGVKTTLNNMVHILFTWTSSVII